MRSASAFTTIEQEFQKFGITQAYLEPGALPADLYETIIGRLTGTIHEAEAHPHHPLACDMLTRKSFITVCERKPVSHIPRKR